MLISMSTITEALPYIQIFLSIILTASILLQQSSAGLGGTFGGSDSLSTFHTRRGFEKVLFYTAIITAVLFAIASFAAILV